MVLLTWNTGWPRSRYIGEVRASVAGDCDLFASPVVLEDEPVMTIVVDSLKSIVYSVST